MVPVYHFYYFIQVISKLDEENFRSRKFLNPSSYTKVTKECEQKMVADHLQMLHSECREMVKTEKSIGKRIKDIIYHLFRIILHFNVTIL